MWLRRFEMLGYETVAGAAVDEDGRVFVPGSTAEHPIASSPAGTLGYVAVFGAGGEELRSWTFGGVMNEAVDDVAVGDVGVVVVGMTSNPLGVREYDLRERSSEQLDAFVAVFDEEGGERWVRQFGAGRGYRGRAVALREDGDLYVAGRGNGSFGGEHLGASDAFVARYGADGVLAWARRWGTPEFDSAEGVAVTPDGGVVVVGYQGQTWEDLRVANHMSRSLFVTRFDSDGEQVWFTTLEAPLPERE